MLASISYGEKGSAAPSLVADYVEFCQLAKPLSFFHRTLAKTSPIYVQQVHQDIKSIHQTFVDKESKLCIVQTLNTEFKPLRTDDGDSGESVK